MLFLAVIGAIFGIASAQSVAFSAGLSYNVTYDHDDTVVFDHVFSNMGNAYDPATGIFTCPNNDAGIYAFQLHTMSHLDGSSWLEIYHNDVYIATVYAHANGDYSTGGNSVVLQLLAGDTVKVAAVDPQYGDTTTLYGGPDERYSTFSGYLLAPVHSEVSPVGK